MQSYASNLAQAAAAAGFLITILSLVALCVRGFERIIKIPGQVRNYFFRPKFILIPTVDDLAKYCAKEPEHYRQTREEMLEDRRGKVASNIRYFRAQAGARLGLMIFSFAVCYLLIIIRLVQYGLK